MKTIKTKTKPKKKKKAQTILCCKMCGTELVIDDTYWESINGIFCSEDCLANYEGNEYTIDDRDDYENLLEQYGERK